MQRCHLRLATFATLLAAGAAAMAQTAAPAAPTQSAAAPTQATASAWHHDGMPPMAGMHHLHQMHDMHDMHRDHDSGVIGDLHGLEHLYGQSGRSKEMIAVYQNVLARSQDPYVRDYVYHHLARLQAQPASVDQAIATLRKALDENLANEATLRARREQMRAGWQAHRAGAATAPATPPAK